VLAGGDPGPQREYRSGEAPLNLLFELITSMVAGLSFKGHRELWPDDVDKWLHYTVVPVSSL